MDKDGKPAAWMRQASRSGSGRLCSIMRFRIVTVFDISQTEGKELPSIGVSELSGNIDRFEELANAITSVSPVPILYAAPPGAAEGLLQSRHRRNFDTPRYEPETNGQNHAA